MIDPVRPVPLADIEAARERIAGIAMRTPLVRLDLGAGGPDIRLKLENLQPTNAYKIRGASNAVASLSEAERARGVWTISAGNAGQGVAYAARAAGIPCSVVAIETAPQTKLERMRALGATIVPVSYEQAWQAAEAHAFDGLDGTFIHPFDDHDFIAGHGTMGLEILEDAPDVRTVIAAIGGGGLITGVGSAIKALRPDVRLLGAEPETAAPFAYSLREGGPRKYPGWQASFVDGAGGQERHRADVGADAAAGRRRDHRIAGAGPRGDAPDGRQGAGHRGRGRRPRARRRAHRRGGRGSDRVRRLRRQYRPQEIRRAGDRLSVPPTPPTDSGHCEQREKAKHADCPAGHFRGGHPQLPGTALAPVGKQLRSGVRERFD